MKKLSTLFKKDPNDLGRVINEINPENMWVFEGKAIATRKFDGTAVSIIKNELYKRYDCKLYTGKQLKKRNYYLDLLEVGVIVSKVSNKPFENGEKQAAIKEFSTHPITNVDSAILSCGSNIDLRQLKPIGVLPSKYYKPIPEGAIPCQNPDSITGHWPHWVKCDRNNPEDKWHWEGYDNLLRYYTDILFDGIPNVKIPDGTYELIGEKIQGNPENVEGHFLTKHGWQVIDWEGDYSFENVKRIVEYWPFEGIVFHHKDENDDRMCKIRKTDFGLTRKKKDNPDAFLGEEVVDISKSKYALYTPQDYVMIWIERYSGIDGGHHKDWLVDQVARILKGTKVIVKIAKWGNGHTEERFSLDEPPKEYWDWVKEMKNGEDGENTYDYDFGIAP